MGETVCSLRDGQPRTGKGSGVVGAGQGRGRRGGWREEEGRLEGRGGGRRAQCRRPRIFRTWEGFQATAWLAPGGPGLPHFWGSHPPSPAEGAPFVPSPRDLANISRLRDEQQYDSFYFSSWILPPAQEKKEEAYSLREERTGEAFWEVWERVSEGCLPPGCAACGGYHSPSIPTPPSGPPVAPAAL